MQNSKLKTPRILFYDIESTPLLSYTWGLWKQNVIQVKQDWFMLSFAYKWSDQKTTKVISLADFKGYKRNKSNDKELVTKLWELFNEADIICGHNSNAFDNKKSFARFIFHGLKPPPPYKTIDTLREARKYFAFSSNKLNEIGLLLGVGHKKETGGFDLWKGCMEGDMKSWAKMKAYNKQDVVLLEKIYLKLRPYMRTHPFMGQDNGRCKSCTSSHLQKRGFEITKKGKRQRFQCQDCGAWTTL